MTRPYVEAPLTPELVISDMTASLDFYVGMLGFIIQYQRRDEDFASIERHGSRLMLEQYISGKRNWISAPLEKPYGRGVNFQMETPDVNALYEKVQKSDAVVFMPLEEKWYRADGLEIGHRQFIVLDPDGYMLRFYEDLGQRPVKREP
jgi:catechol 2,3-dioxygenase-like lactoylglutathione lyase family enzyme